MEWEAERERRRPEGRKKAPLEAIEGGVRMADAMAGATKLEKHMWAAAGRRIGGGGGRDLQLVNPDNPREPKRVLGG